MTQARPAPALLAPAPIGVLVAALIATSLTACERKNGDPATLEAEVSPADVQRALAEPLRTMDASTMQKGAFAHWQDTQTLAASVTVALADTGQTIDDRDDASEPDYVLYNIVERKFTYSGSETREVTTERDAAAAKPRPPASPRAPLASSLASSLALAWSSPLARPLRLPATVETIEAVALGRGGSTPFGLTSSGFAALAFAPAASASGFGRVSYHGLKTSRTQAAPPELVRKRPNCGGLPGCSLTLHRIEFDQALWQNGRPDKTHFVFEMSPDVPFLASLMNRCVTALVPVGQTKTLLTQCSPVLDFRF